jgi:hypothetical protein
MEPIESPQLLMKQAEAWGLGSMPTLNQTGELKDATWLDDDAASRLQGVAVGGGLEIPAFLP